MSSEHKWQMFQLLCKVFKKSILIFLLNISYLKIFDILLMQSFNLYHPLQIYISKYRSYQQLFCYLKLFFPANYWGKGYILLINISLHIYQNPCIRSVTDIQYKLSLLYYLGYNSFPYWTVRIFFIRKNFFI